ncbi:lysozyme [Serratia nevei]|uniref:lysozyme n=1 Tax=Serratia nevei TaxID=2703794 RepID=UPI003FA760F3
MEISKTGIDLIKKFEGCELKAYQDSVGVWTIGYGWTHPVNGRKVEAGMVITQETAESLLREGVKPFADGVSKLVTAPINQNQFDALVSFAYNLGLKSLKDSTLLKLLNAGNKKGAADEFLKWCRAGGKILNGLVKRRTAERELFLQ